MCHTFLYFFIYSYSQRRFIEWHAHIHGPCRLKVYTEEDEVHNWVGQKNRGCLMLYGMRGQYGLLYHVTLFPYFLYVLETISNDCK